MAISPLNDINFLKSFQFERVLNEDPVTHSLTLLGKLPDSRSPDALSNAVVRIEKTALSSDSIESVWATLEGIKFVEHTDIYGWLFAWFKPSSDRPDVKINVVHPATEVHIRKYSRQQIVMVRETPQLYQTIVKPYIAALPTSRIQWVYDILSGDSEAEKVLFRDDDPALGFVILPDMKWDLTTLSSLYLVALATSHDIHSLRDLTKGHIPMLRKIQNETKRIVTEKWNLDPGVLRFYIHYQPSYYHFHVHIVNANFVGTIGSTVGQALLLDDVISLLELDPDGVGSDEGVLQRWTLTYGLGEQHGLFEPMRAAQEGL